MANKEKKPGSGKGLRIFAILLMLIAFGLIGYGVYSLYNVEYIEDVEEIEEETEPASEELDIKSEEVVSLFNQLAFNSVSVPGVDDSIKDFYYTKTEINDDLKLFLAFMANDKFNDYDSSENVVIPVSELEETISSMFESKRTDDYKTMNLGKGIVATYDANAKSYTISSIGEIPDDSRYYGELTSANKSSDGIVLTVTAYYASLEQGENGAVYKIYSDSSKKEAVSEESYEALPEIEKLSSDKLNLYAFTFVEVDGTYKLSAFEKIVRE